MDCRYEVTCPRRREHRDLYLVGVIYEFADPPGRPFGGLRRPNQDGSVRVRHGNYWNMKPYVYIE